MILSPDLRNDFVRRRIVINKFGEELVILYFEFQIKRRRLEGSYQECRMCPNALHTKCLFAPQYGLRTSDLDKRGHEILHKNSSKKLK